MKLVCDDDRRRAAVRAADRTGLDYLQVSADQRTLTVFFLGRAPELEPANLRVEGGQVVRDIQVVDIAVYQPDDAELDDWAEVTVDRFGDSTPYVLRLIGVEHVDPRFDRLTFGFKEGCPSDLDCAAEPICPLPERSEPELSYLAKDYATFRQLILDRLALVMPQWRETHAADIEMALVELLAYTGDQLSYQQDAVATEAYLDTARQRISVRRHARLVDYRVHEGCNARAWVCVGTDTPLDLAAGAVAFVTRPEDADESAPPALTPDFVDGFPAGSYAWFEPLPAAPIRLVPGHSTIRLYTWGDRRCCLPSGTTAATLMDGPRLESDDADPNAHRVLEMQPGDLLVFEERMGPGTGKKPDADPTHRHVVRLTRAERTVDTLYGQPLVEVAWDSADALPFPLCVSTIGPAAGGCMLLENVSVARGNVILVDHGRPGTQAWQVGVGETIAVCEAEGVPGEVSVVAEPFAPVLAHEGLTFAQALPAGSPPAAELAAQDVRAALPQIRLNSTPPDRSWQPRADLLDSGPDDGAFVVEMDDRRLGHLRFGDGLLGRAPDPGAVFTATYRVGSGTVGNVGANAIRHIVFLDGSESGARLRVHNPLAATGGTDPEPVQEVKLLAPGAFRAEPLRAITADDYASVAERVPGVQRAAAELRWNGSWYEAVVSVDPLGGEVLEARLARAVRAQLERCRRIGHDVRVRPARYVGIDLALRVCVLPHHLRGHVESELQDVLSARRLPDGRLGLFHPDMLTFGDDVLLSRIAAAAQAVTGVESVVVTRLQRVYEHAHGELDSGRLVISALEVARLDNDPDRPQNGRLRLDVRGGR